MTLLTQHREVSPYGMKDGEVGAKGSQVLTRSNGKKEDLPGITTLNIKTGDKLTILTPGGGGYGKKEQ
jgi:N-methylhydantoinase B/oxoprolinase/acetone carboxylase alpha subunit